MVARTPGVRLVPTEIGHAASPADPRGARGHRARRRGRRGRRADPRRPGRRSVILLAALPERRSTRAGLPRAGPAASSHETRAPASSAPPSRPYRRASSRSIRMPSSRATRVPASVGDQPGAITHRERVEVLGMLSEGLGNKAIAVRLDISTHTAKFHVASILAKLGRGQPHRGRGHRNETRARADLTTGDPLPSGERQGEGRRQRRAWPPSPQPSPSKGEGADGAEPPSECSTRSGSKGSGRPRP